MKKFLAMCFVTVIFCCSFVSMFAEQENSADMLRDDFLILGEDKVYGISVSVWQGDIDWKKAKKSGVKFAIIRDGYGRNEPGQIDTKFERNIKLAKEAGIDVGVYHYSYAKSPEDAVNEANFCLSNIDGRKLTYPVAFDIEDKSVKHLDKRTLTDICIAFCETIKSAGYTPAIYCYSDWIEENRFFMDDLSAYDLWISDWDVDAPSYDCAIWQCSDKGSISGIKGDVCIEVAFKNYGPLK